MTLESMVVIFSCKKKVGFDIIKQPIMRLTILRSSLRATTNVSDETQASNVHLLLQCFDPPIKFI